MEDSPRSSKTTPPSASRCCTAAKSPGAGRQLLVLVATVAGMAYCLRCRPDSSSLVVVSLWGFVTVLFMRLTTRADASAASDSKDDSARSQGPTIESVRALAAVLCSIPITRVMNSDERRRYRHEVESAMREAQCREVELLAARAVWDTAPSIDRVVTLIRQEHGSGIGTELENVVIAAVRKRVQGLDCSPELREALRTLDTPLDASHAQILPSTGSDRSVAPSAHPPASVPPKGKDASVAPSETAQPPASALRHDEHKLSDLVGNQQPMVADDPSALRHDEHEPSDSVGNQQPMVADDPPDDV